MDEVLCQAVADLALFFMGNFKRRASTRGLPDGGVSFCSSPNRFSCGMDAACRRSRRRGPRHAAGAPGGRHLGGHKAHAMLPHGTLRAR